MISLYGTMFGSMLHYTSDLCIGRSLDLYGQWAIDEIAILAKILRSSPTGDFIDMGANVGTHTVSMAKLFPAINVYSFEAQNEMFRLLCANTVINGLSNTVLNRCLLTDASALSHIRSSLPLGTQNFGAVTFAVLDRQEDRLGADLLPQIALDDVYPSDRNVAVIKADVEEMELEALCGAERIIDRCFPTIYFEVTSEDRTRPLFDLLRAKEYELFWHVNFPFDQNNFRQAPLNFFGDNVERNVVAFHRSGGLAATLGAGMTAVETPYSDSVKAACVPLNAQLRAELRASMAPGISQDITGSIDRKLISDFIAVRNERIAAQMTIERQEREIADLKQRVKRWWA